MRHSEGGVKVVVRLIVVAIWPIIALTKNRHRECHPTFSRLALPFWVSSALVTNYSFKYGYVKKMLQKSKKKS